MKTRHEFNFIVQVLNVNAHASSLVLWTSVYAAQASHTDHDIVPPTDESTGLQRSQSYSDLSTSTGKKLCIVSVWLRLRFEIFSRYQHSTMITHQHC